MQTHQKAVVAFIAAFLGSLLTVWTDTDPLTARDCVVALAAALGTAGVVWTVPNK